MKKFFQLDNACIYITGNNNGAIYNLTTGDIISLNKEWSTTVALLEKGTPIEELYHFYDQQLINEILDELFVNHLGKYLDKWRFNEKYRRGVIKKMTSDTAFRIMKCFIELPTDCGLNCTFCTKLKTFPCQACSISTKRPLNFDENFYHNILKRILLMNVQNLIFYGGDPLTDWEKLSNILEFSRKLANQSTKIFLITNGSLFNTEKAEKFVNYGVQPIIVFDCTGDCGKALIEKTNILEPALNILKTNHIPFSATVIMDPKSKINKNQIKTLNKLSFQLITYLMILENIPKDKTPLALMNPNLVRINAETFYNRVHHHPCLYGTLTITADKKMIPCPALDDEVLLDLSTNNPIDVAFEEHKISKYWDLALSKVEYCKECEFKYGCADCRGIEKKLTGDLYGKEMCSYKGGK